MRPSQRRCFVRALAIAGACLLSGSALALPPPESKTPSAAAAAQPRASAPPPPLSTSLTGMAKAEFEAAKILYRDNDFANAIVKYQHAYDLAGDPRLLWNIAACEKNLRRYSRALTAIERYQREGGASLTEEDRRDAKDIEKVLQTLISSMTLLVSEPGAEAFVDDEKIGTSPLGAPARIDVGNRTIRVHKPGFKDFVETRQVEGGTEFTLIAKLEKEIHQGRVIIEAGPKDLIALDGKVVAEGRFEGVVSSGGHSLRVTAPGMAAHQTEILVQDDKTRRISVALNPLAKAGDAPPWVWIAGGAALVAGAVVGGAFLFRPAEAPAAQGTLGTFPLSSGGLRWR
jgi:hypothetical protein